MRKNALHCAEVNPAQKARHPAFPHFVIFVGKKGIASRINYVYFTVSTVECQMFFRFLSECIKSKLANTPFFTPRRSMRKNVPDLFFFTGFPRHLQAFQLLSQPFFCSRFPDALPGSSIKNGRPPMTASGCHPPGDPVGKL